MTCLAYGPQKKIALKLQEQIIHLSNQLALAFASMLRPRANAFCSGCWTLACFGTANALVAASDILTGSCIPVDSGGCDRNRLRFGQDSHARDVLTLRKVRSPSKHATYRMQREATTSAGVLFAKAVTKTLGKHRRSRSWWVPRPGFASATCLGGVRLGGR